MSKKLHSVFTDDLEHCFFTGKPGAHIHHIFPGSRRSASEEYGYIIPLAPELHVGAPYAIHENPNKGLDWSLKLQAQKHFEKYYGTRNDFREIFGKSYL